MTSKQHSDHYIYSFGSLQSRNSVYKKNEYVQSQIINTGTQHAQIYIPPCNTSKLKLDTKNGMKILE